MKELVRKSNGFIPMNLSNPKEELSDAEGIDCIGQRRSKAVVLKEKWEAFLEVLLWAFSTHLTGLRFGLVFPVYNPYPKG